METNKKIISILKKKKEPLTQNEISKELNLNRAVLLGYLRCMVDLKFIKSKYSGKAKIYFI